MLTEIVLAGSGGQGIQFAGQVLAQAAVHQGLTATYLPSYGAERRGGTSFCFVAIADEPIYAPQFTHPDVLLAFDQRGREQYAATLEPGGLIIANGDLAGEAAAGETGVRVVTLPAATLAEQIHSDAAVNLIMISAYAALSGQVSPDHLRATVEDKSRRKPELLATNLAALGRGAAWIKEQRP
jgi:2-oxoglutarate ferredoxin oxidoreductase subunit gamma